ncbi:MAG: diacylglycerol kinase family lipid kinase [Gemmatimonadota bacterium]|nr:diacylglycerol kinase family lipid kinase [Gemmatimonadota bacterium]
MKNEIVVILNPAAGRGSTLRLLPQIRESFGAIGIIDFRETRTAGHEEGLAREAIARNATTIVAVGGDGTCTRIANAILKSGRFCRLAVVPTGTGNDFAKTLCVQTLSVEAIAQLVARGHSTPVDVGRIEDDFFLNSCGFGFDASALEASNRVRFLKGDAIYIYSALRQLFTYRGVEVSANVGNVKLARMLMVTVSNGRWLGGAFEIAPDASVLDGKLDVCFFSDSNVLERARLFLGALRGTHLAMRAVSSASVQELVLTFAEPPSMEIDGELRTAKSTTVKLKCVPRALEVVAAPGALA